MDNRSAKRNVGFSGTSPPATLTKGCNSKDFSHVPAANARTQAGEWPKNDFMGVEVTGKTLGLIGAGNIGSIVAARALGLRMKVIAFDPFLTSERAIEIGVEKVDLDTLLGRADFITLYTPLTDETRNILSRENLAKTKKGVKVVVVQKLISQQRRWGAGCRVARGGEGYVSGLEVQDIKKKRLSNEL